MIIIPHKLDFWHSTHSWEVSCSCLHPRRSPSGSRRRTRRWSRPRCWSCCPSSSRRKRRGSRLWTGVMLRRGNRGEGELQKKTEKKSIFDETVWSYSFVVHLYQNSYFWAARCTLTNNVSMSLPEGHSGMHVISILMNYIYVTFSHKEDLLSYFFFGDSG